MGGLEGDEGCDDNGRHLGDIMLMVIVSYAELVDLLGCWVKAPCVIVTGAFSVGMGPMLFRSELRVRVSAGNIRISDTRYLPPPPISCLRFSRSFNSLTAGTPRLVKAYVIKTIVIQIKMRSKRY